MSKPSNSAARNAMSQFERQCYDWGWQDAEARIIKLLEPLAQHDEFCAQGCYPEDCLAPTYQHAIELIKGDNHG